MIASSTYKQTSVTASTGPFTGVRSNSKGGGVLKPLATVQFLPKTAKRRWYHCCKPLGSLTPEQWFEARNQHLIQIYLTEQLSRTTIPQHRINQEKVKEPQMIEEQG